MIRSAEHLAWDAAMRRAHHRNLSEHVELLVLDLQDLRAAARRRVLRPRR
jgi:hypothetical protein